MTLASLKPEFAGTPEAHDFREKAQLLAIFDHPRSIEILDFENVGNDLCMVTEVVDGVDLASVIAEAAISAQDFEALVEDTLSWAVAWENYSDRDLIIDAADVKLDWPSASCFVFKICDFTLVGKNETTDEPDKPGRRHLIASLLRLYRAALTGRLSDCSSAEPADEKMAALHAKELRQLRPDLPADRLCWLNWAELPAAAGGPQSADHARTELYRPAKPSIHHGSVAAQAPAANPAPAPIEDTAPVPLYLLRELGRPEPSGQTQAENEAKPSPIEDTAPVPLHLLRAPGRTKQTGRARSNGAQPAPAADTAPPPPPVKTALNGPAAGAGRKRARRRNSKSSRKRNIKPIPLIVETGVTGPPANGADRSASNGSAENPSNHHRHHRSGNATSQRAGDSRNGQRPSPQQPDGNPQRGPSGNFRLSREPLKIGIAACLMAGVVFALALLPLLTPTPTAPQHHVIAGTEHTQPAEKAPPLEPPLVRASPEAVTLTQREPTPAQAQPRDAAAVTSSAPPLADTSDTSDSADNTAKAQARQTDDPVGIAAAPAEAPVENRTADDPATVRRDVDATAELAAIVDVKAPLEPVPAQAPLRDAAAVTSSAPPLADSADSADTADTADNIATAQARQTDDPVGVAAAAAEAPVENRTSDDPAEVRSDADVTAELAAIVEAVAENGLAGLEAGSRDATVQRLTQLLQPAAGAQTLPAADIDRAIAACFANSSDFGERETDLLKLAANQYDSASAKRLMARQLRSSEGEAPALPWTLTAAEAGDVDSMLSAGLFLMSKQGRQSPHAGEAVEWLGRAARAGHADGIYYYAECLLLGKGVAKDEATAIDLLTSADAGGDARAADLLGVCYSRGLGGLDVDTDRAAALFEKAVQLGNHSALANLAVFYFNGTGVEKSDVRAIELLQQGVAQNNPACLLIYARCLENGLGIKKNEDEARRCYQLAAEAGSRQAAQHLKDSLPPRQAGN